MNVDEPLFGATTRRELYVERFSNAFIITIALLTNLAGLIRAIYTGNFVHVLLGLCVALLAAIEVRLINWYRRGDLEPTFKHILLLLGLTITLLSVTANLYFFL